MAKEADTMTISRRLFWGVMTFFITLVCSGFAIAWKGGGRVACVETNMVHVEDKVDNVAKKHEDLEKRVTEQEKMNIRIDGHLSNISIHMEQQTRSTNELTDKVDTIDGKVDVVIIDNVKLEAKMEEWEAIKDGQD